MSRAPLTGRDVRALGHLVKAPNTGPPIQSPWLAVMNRQTDIARELAAELALPPRSAAGLAWGHRPALPPPADEWPL